MTLLGKEMIQQNSSLGTQYLLDLRNIPEKDVKKFEEKDNWRKPDTAKGTAWTTLSADLASRVARCNTGILNDLAKENGWLFMKYTNPADDNEVVIRFSEDYLQPPRISASETEHEMLSDARHILELRKFALNATISVINGKDQLVTDDYLKQLVDIQEVGEKDTEALRKLLENSQDKTDPDQYKLLAKQLATAVENNKTLFEQIKKLQAEQDQKSKTRDSSAQRGTDSKGEKLRPDEKKPTTNDTPGSEIDGLVHFVTPGKNDGAVKGKPKSGVAAESGAGTKKLLILSELDSEEDSEISDSMPDTDGPISHLPNITPIKGDKQKNYLDGRSQDVAEPSTS
jgi:hypothetical protein